MSELTEGRTLLGCELTDHYAAVAADRLRTVRLGYRDDGQQAALDLDGGAA